jgi:hypothetical protein
MFIAVGGLMLLASLGAHRWLRDNFPAIAFGLLLRASVGSIIVGLLAMAGLRPNRLRSVDRRRQGVVVILVVLVVGTAIAFWRVMVPLAFLSLLFSLYLRYKREGNSL